MSLIWTAVFYSYCWGLFLAIQLSELLRSKTIGLKQESLEEYEKADSNDDKDKHGDSSSLRFTDTRGPSSTAHDSPTSMIILGNEKEHLTASNFLNLLSKSKEQQMPMSTIVNKLKKKKKSETIGMIAIVIKFISLCPL